MALDVRDSVFDPRGRASVLEVETIVYTTQTHSKERGDEFQQLDDLPEFV